MSQEHANVKIAKGLSKVIFIREKFENVLFHELPSSNTNCKIFTVGITKRSEGELRRRQTAKVNYKFRTLQVNS